jgi:hypothetical protein
MPDPLSDRDRKRRRPSEASSPLEPIAYVLVAVGLLVGAVLLYRLLDTRREGLLKELPSRSATPRTLGLAGMRYDAAARVIEGRVRNYTENVYENVAVTFEVLGRDSTVLGTVRDSAAAVAPDSTWRFRIPVAQPNVVRVRLVHYAATRRGGTRSNVNVTQDV